MRRLATLIVLTALSAPAHAACTQLTADGFRGFVDDAMAAIDDDDLVRHGAVFRAMQEQIPCLDGPVPIDAWSEFLVGFAVVEYAMGREWKPALDAALRINPTIPRDYGPVEVRSYASALDIEPDDAPALPEGARYFVDGKEVHRVPELGKLHIVQREKDGVWTSYLLLGEPWPDEWRPAPEAPPDEGPGMVLRASVYAVGGLAAGGQSLGQDASNLIPEDSAAGALVGVGSFGDFGPSGPVGLFWDVTGPLSLTGASALGNGMGVEAYIGPALFAGPVAGYAGVGMTTVGVADVNGSRLVILPQPRLGGRFVREIVSDLDMDLGVGGGWAPPGWHGRMHAGVRGGGDMGWNAGLFFSANGANLVEEAGTGLTASATAIRVGLRGGLSFGQ